MISSRKFHTNLPILTPKHAFSWIAILNRFATKDRLRRLGLSIDECCILCGVENESRDHLFFSCSFSFSKALLQSILELCGLHRQAFGWHAY